MSSPPTLTRELVLSPDTRARADVSMPDAALLDLPEKVVQFGTGAFLRGFVEHFVDAANRQGRFGGRVVAVGSTGSGRDQVLGEQDGLYTLLTQGVERGEVRESYRVIASLSRALSARDQWDEVLACARMPQLEVVVSNTTEVGIALDEEDRLELSPPRSFPGKLTRFLLERGRAFQFAPERGVVVLPCELIEDNGDRLREIVLTLAERWSVEESFGRWIRESVPFCNTLVDRIVPGKPGAEHLEEHWRRLGYRDEMLTACESYRLFAIQGDEALRQRLDFADADPGVVVTDDVSRFRMLKVRILNGTHTIMVPAALLCGMQTVSEAMADERIGRLVREIVFDEIVPTVHAPGAREFGEAVLDRFSNPFIHHALLDITLQSTMKMRVRVVPTLLEYARLNGRAPRGVAFGFAMYLLFLRGDVQDRARAQGANVPADDQADRFRALWRDAGDDEAAISRMVRAVCADRGLWDTDLSEIPGLVEAVTEHLLRARRDGAPAALDALLQAPVG